MKSSEAKSTPALLSQPVKMAKEKKAKTDTKKAKLVEKKQKQERKAERRPR